MSKKNILITNDDGFESRGLHELADALSSIANVTVVAPSTEKSACGHSLTLTRPLNFIEIKDNFYKLDDGTPTDCVFLSLNKLFDDQHRPDIVISGINRGANMGEDITYSGTASAAMEAVLQNIPAVAISQLLPDDDADTIDYELAKQSIVEIVKKIFEGSFPLASRKFLNINIPHITPNACKGLKITRAGNRIYANNADVHYNPRGSEYYWIGLPGSDWLDNGGHITDYEATNNGYISITPIHLDMTSHDDIAILERWL